MSQRWRTLQRVTLSPGKIGKIAQDTLVLVQFEHKMITRKALRKPWPSGSQHRLLPRRRSGVTNALHPYRADVLAVLDRVLAERAHLGEAKLAVQRDRRVVRQGYPSQGNMNRRLNSQAVKKRVIQRGAHALAPAADIKRDADLNGLPESLEIPVALGAGVAHDLIATPGHQKPVRSGRTELAEPVASLGHADRLCLEARDGAGRRVVEDADDRRRSSSVASVIFTWAGPPCLLREACCMAIR